MLNSYDASFVRLLATRLAEERAARSALLAEGVASSFEDYRARSGYIRALMDVADWCEEIERKLG